MDNRGTLLRKFGLKGAKMPMTPLLGPTAVQELAKRHARETGLDHDATVEAFMQHLKDQDATYILQTGDSHEDIEPRFLQACLAAEHGTHLRHSNKIADQIEKAMAKAAERR